MTNEQQLAARARRERTGSEKQAIGFENIQRMLPLVVKTMTEGEPSRRDLAMMGFAPDMMPMMMENAYCDMWGRSDVIDGRVRSLFTVSLMIGVGNVGNEFELDYHAPGAIYNGATLAELEAIIVQAAAYVGYPAAGRAMNAIVDALLNQNLLGEPSPPADAERRELTGSEKRAKALEVLSRMQPDSPLLRVRDENGSEVFAGELDQMILENVYYDLWARTDVLDLKTRSVVTLGLIMGLGNLDALGEHVPMAMRNGITVAELEEFVYHAATYVGFMSATSLRKVIAAAL
jgi:4-carboxymuconolactone decarboxylase